MNLDTANTCNFTHRWELIQSALVMVAGNETSCWEEVVEDKGWWLFIFWKLSLKEKQSGL